MKQVTGLIYLLLGLSLLFTIYINEVVIPQTQVVTTTTLGD